MAQKEGGSRLALLTEQERRHLQSRAPLNQKVLTKLTGKLSRRMEAAIKDTELILTSPHLEIWRSFNNGNIARNDLTSFIQLLEKLKSVTFRPAYIYPVKFFGRGSEQRYWIDYNEPSTVQSARIFSPDFALRRVKNEAVRRILRQPLIDGIIPRFRVDAMTLEQIRRNHRDGVKYELGSIQITNAVPELKRLKEEMNTPLTNEQEIVIQYIQSVRNIENEASRIVDEISQKYNAVLSAGGFTETISDLLVKHSKARMHS